MKRRSFLQKLFWGMAGISSLGGMYAWQLEPFWLEFVKISMPIKNLPSHLEGKKLMQISDMHIGKRFDYQFLIESFKKANEFTPDFVVYTGDYVSTYKDQVLFGMVKEVFSHLVKGKIGTFGILGNHDYGKNFQEEEVASQLSNLLEINGVKVLRNEKVSVDGLDFIGIDDYWGTNFQPEKAMSMYKVINPSIVLCHNPDVCDLDIWGDYSGWILSGHTHGGLVKPPFL